MKLNLKKLRFMVLSFALIALSYFLSSKCISSDSALHNLTLTKYIVLLGIVTVLSSLFVQYVEGGDSSIKIYTFVGFTPALLVVGTFMFFVFYPNLSILLKVAAAIFYMVLLYTLLLLNNVLIVVKSREVSIPVYRVAVNWVQIVLLGVSITNFTGILRINIQPLFQLALIIGISLFHYLYLVWVYSNEQDIRQVKAYEALVLCISFALLVGWSVFTTLFFPAESFLRGIFIASVFLLGLGYIQLYLKNSISKKSIWNYLLIVMVFFTIAVAFKP